MQHDMVVDNGPGAVVLLDMQNVLQALASCSSGPAEPTVMTAGMFWLDTSIAGGFLRQRNRDNLAWMTVAGVPERATVAEAAAGLDTAKYLTPRGVAARQAAARGYARNRLVNPAMQVSQENVDVAGSTNGYFPADQWSFFLNIGAANYQRVQSRTPNGSANRLRFAVTTAGADTGFVYLTQYIEGVRVADFGWGAAGGKPAIMRFGFRGPAGTYSCSLHNHANNMVFVANFTISAAQANIDTELVFPIPAVATGVWPVDNTRGMYFVVSILTPAGVTYGSGVQPPQWLASGYFALAGVTNGMATVGNVFELFDCGLYVDLDGSGVPPRWQMPDEFEETRACQRYYCQVPLIFSDNVPGAQGWYTVSSTPVDMRGMPTMTTLAANNTQSANFPATTNYLFSLPRTMRAYRVATAALANSLYQNVAALNARM